MSEENIWTDKQKEEYNRLVDEYFEHPICGKCGTPLDKRALSMDDLIDIGVGVIQISFRCPACGAPYLCSWGDLPLGTLDDDSIQERMDIAWLNYADLLAKKAHPDWWDFSTMMPVRRDIE